MKLVLNDELTVMDDSEEKHIGTIKRNDMK